MKIKTIKFYKPIYLLLLILSLAIIFRTIGYNWDQNEHLHPDERFLTMVASDIKLPSSISQYFDTANSPLNPYNYPQYQFFVYGTFPLFLTKILATLFHLDNYNQITLVGRILSAIFDSGNIILLYFISKKFLKSFYIYLPSIFYTFLVLPIQLSHFFAVDTFLNFFILLTFTLLVYNLFLPAFFAFGLALSCKISAIYFIPIVYIFVFKEYISTNKKYIFILKNIIYLLITFLAFRIFQPYAFTNLFNFNPQFINNLKTLSSYSSPNISYPPAVQWINRRPILNSIKNTTIWGLGLTISIPLFILFFRFLKKLKIKFNLILIISIWILFLFIYQSVQFSHSMRYFILTYPFICLVFSSLLSHFKIKKSILILIIILNIFYALAFISIYCHPNSRIQASNWIFQNISKDSTISSEYWDDFLPLGDSSYKNISLAFFEPDTSTKWSKINESLFQVDYQIMSSNRLWASIPRLPDQYPLTSKFYSDLFSNKLSFSLIKKFNSYPGYSLSSLKKCYYFGPSNYPGINNTWLEIEDNCSFPGIYFRDDTAEEAFTVYDHPQVLIFKKK